MKEAKEIKEILSDIRAKSLILNSLAGYEEIEITINGITFHGSPEKIKNQLIRISKTFEGLEV